MIRIQCQIVIGLVASNAGGRGIVIVSMMAIITGSSLVRPVQWPVTVVYREGGWLPGWRGRMTHRAIRWDDQGYVIRIQARIVIWRVTARAGIGRVVVIAVVTGIAIICNGNVRPGEGINRIVIKCRWYPSRFSMTNSTIRRELGRDMVGIGRPVVVSLVAT